ETVEGFQQPLSELGANLYSAENIALWRSCAASARALLQFAANLRHFVSERPPKLVMCRMDKVVDEVIAAAVGRGAFPPEVKVERDYEEEPPVNRGDAEQLKFAVWQLLMNAVQAARDGGEVLARVFSADVDDAPAVVVEIMNTGAPIREEDARKAFEPFHGNTPGAAGLGLTLCRRVIAAHGGRIGIDRVEGWTRAGFFLPLDPRGRTAGRAAPPAGLKRASG
ncbi:MAG: ATP-binding protein, partial [bacterium]